MVSLTHVRLDTTALRELSSKLYDLTREGGEDLKPLLPLVKHLPELTLTVFYSHNLVELLQEEGEGAGPTPFMTNLIAVIKESGLLVLATKEKNQGS